MTPYQRVIAPILFRFDPERMHEATLDALAVAQRSALGLWLLRRIAGTVPALPVDCLGLRFANYLGVAAGYDKEARVIGGLAALGFGHVEVGTLTPRPQPGNPKPRVFRLPDYGALINRMGFPNQGVEAAVSHLRRPRPEGAVVGVSLGKQKETPLADALDDYVTVMRAVYPYADYLAINVSSPNTPGLRALQGGRYLGQLLAGIHAESVALAGQHGLSPRPWLVKIAPDLSWEEIDEILGAAETAGAAGVIATNTTITRDGVTGPAAIEAGGLSGLPLLMRSREIIAYVRAHARAPLAIIGVGGVRTAADARAHLEAGADLVQVYTGLVYEGPGMAGRLLRGEV
jgi:dihydroorotate dehydrogenase